MCIKEARKVDWNIKHAYKVLGNSCKGLITTTFAMSLKETNEWQYPLNERLYPYPQLRNNHFNVVNKGSYFENRKHKNKINVFLDEEDAILYANKVWKQSVHFFGAPTEVWKVEVDYDVLIVGEDSCEKKPTALVDRIRLVECIYPKEKIRNIVIPRTEINNENIITEVESNPIKEKMYILLEE